MTRKANEESCRDLEFELVKAGSVPVKSQDKPMEQAPRKISTLDLSSVPKILDYLATTKDKLKDAGEPSRREVQLAKAFWIALAGFFFVGFLLLVCGIHRSLVVAIWIGLFLSSVGVLGLAWVSATAPRMFRTKNKWRRPVVVRTFERDEAYVDHLAACQESLLNHAKGTLQRHVDRVKNRMDGIIKPVGVLSTVALVGTIWTGWNALLSYMANLHLGSGGLELIRDYGFYWIILIFIGLQVARLSVWWATDDYTYRIELIDSAIERKKVIEDQ